MHNHKGQRVTMEAVLRNRPNKGQLRKSSAIVTLYSLPPLDPPPQHPLHSTTPWQSFVYIFGHYSMGRLTKSYPFPFDRQW